ncbi:hypothetical protein [Spirulina sp. CS-785/01]|uniref:hypothetical protein n=1 Tax=Spirulina sp. CS-785/01 TaxID=3021716 RepID=UPI003FA69E31
MTPEQQKNPNFAICLNNQEYEASLEVGKLYRILSDQQAETHGFIRVIDESGEDYLFSCDRFYPLNLPPNVQKTLLAASH